jgi:hypothetical protein
MTKKILKKVRRATIATALNENAKAPNEVPTDP